MTAPAPSGPGAIRPGAGTTVPVSGSAGPPAGQVSRLEAVGDEPHARYEIARGPVLAAAGAVIQDPGERPGG